MCGNRLSETGASIISLARDIRVAPANTPVSIEVGENFRPIKKCTYGLVDADGKP